MVGGQLRVFISHAARDRELAAKFVELLQLSAGVSHSDIFFSSRRGDIPNGSFFVQHIVKELATIDLIVALLSKSYLKSHFCLAETGAALVRKSLGNAEFYSLIVPPLTFADLDGGLYGVQSGSILDLQALSELRDILIRGKADPPPTSTWDDKRQAFLEAARLIVSQLETVEFLRKMRPEISVARTDKPDIWYKSKLRIGFKNIANVAISGGPAEWRSNGDTVPLEGAPSPLKWTAQDENGVWQEEKPEFSVTPGKGFSTWIGLAQTVKDQELLMRSSRRRLGKLLLPVKFAGQIVSLKIKL